MHERIKITSNRILLTNANSGIVFDTNNYYLKTDPTGSLKAGGYLAPPSIYGAGNNITDKNNGGFASTIIGGVEITAQPSYSWRVSVPKATSVKFIITDNVSIVDTSETVSYFSPRYPLYFNMHNYTKNSYYTTAIRIGDFYWRTAVDSNYLTRIYLQFVDTNDQPMTVFPAPERSGFMDFSVDRVTAGTTWLRYVGPTYYGVPTSVNFNTDIMTTDYWGNQTYRAGGFGIQNMLFLSENTPQTLSIARTP